MRSSSSNRVDSLVREIRKRWRRRSLIQGTALSVLTLLCASSLALLVRINAPNSTQTVTAILVIGGVALLYVLYKYVFKALTNKVDDKQLALYIEENVPELEDRLNSAVEIQSSSVFNTQEHKLINRLMDDAASKTSGLSLSTIIDQKRERFLSYAAGTALFLFAILGYSSWDKIGFRNGQISLALPAKEEPFLRVNPGDVELEKGDTQEIVANFRDDMEEEVALHYRTGVEGEWQKEIMTPGLDSRSFLTEFANIQSPIQYYISYDGERSNPFEISLYEFPRVLEINQRYSYPSYTRRAPRNEEDTGDIRGLSGSTVQLNIETSGSSKEAKIVFDDGRELALSSKGDGNFQGQMNLREDGFYTIQLTDETERQNKFPDEYQITALEDEKPYITITDPQKDVRVNAIEEVLVAVTVEDDYGVKDARLKFSINGEEEQSLGLMKIDGEDETTPPNLEEINGEHLFYLEDFGLQPGDVISYYVEAEDYHAEKPEASDMYFIEVIPFDQKYSQANNAGGGGGGQASAIVLSQQQIISATWKLHRERDDMEETEFEESQLALAQAQANLKSNIEERINSTAFSLELRLDETNRKIVEYLREGTKEMAKAIEEIDEGRLHPALTPERRALNNLLRADALNKEKQVAQNQGQGGGGGSSATEERMTELMDLELDISKDKYETQRQQQQGGASPENKELDEALQKIKDLAQKQEKLAEQNRQQEAKGEDKKRFVDQLKRDQDELRRQTESLADDLRQQSRTNEKISKQMEEQLKRVAENMKQAEQALRRDDSQQAVTKQQQALNELQRLQEQLSRSGNSNLKQQAESLAQDFEDFKNQEEELGKDLDTSTQEGDGELNQSDIDRISNQRKEQLETLDQLKQQSQDLQEMSKRDNPEIAKAASNFLRRMQREDLERNMENSGQSIEQGWTEFARRAQKDIESTLERMEDQVRTFQKNLPGGEGEDLAQTLQEVRELMRQMESMQEQSGEQDSSSQSPGQEGQQEGQEQGQGEGQSPESSGEQAGQGSGQSQGQGRDGQAAQRRMQQQIERAQESIDELVERLEGNRNAQRSLQQMRSALTDASGTGTRLEGDSAKSFFDDEVFAPLSQLELELAQQLDQIEIQKKLFGSRKNDVPPQYRDMVEKYYESLSKGSN